MSTYQSSGCKRCGAPCQGSRCRDCERTDRHDSWDLAFTHYECPDCGGITSGPDTVCADCRRDD